MACGYVDIKVSCIIYINEDVARKQPCQTLLPLRLIFKLCPRETKIV